MSYKTLTASFGLTSSWSLTRNVDGIQPITNQSALNASISFTTGTTTANRANELYSQILGVSAGATRDVDLSASLTNVIGDASITFARIKGLRVHLLSASDSADFGTSCSSISFGGSGASNPSTLFFSTTACTHTVETGAVYCYVTPSAAGKALTSATDTFRFTNNDGSVSAAILLTVLGCDA